MDRKKLAEIMGNIDDVYLDESLSYKHRIDIKRVKRISVLVAAVICLTATCVVAVASIPTKEPEKVKNYPEGAEKYMEIFSHHFGSFEEGMSVVLPNNCLRLTAEYQEEGGVNIKVVDIDYSVAPFDTHPNIIIAAFNCNDGYSVGSGMVVPVTLSNGGVV